MEMFDAIRVRRSVRAYSAKPIPPATLDRMKEALRLAPSACNYQPWKFILVSDAALRKDLAELSHRQRWIAEAPLIVVGVAFPAEAYKRMAGSGNSAEMDVTIALDHLTLAAAAEGLGTCWIGAFDGPRVNELLHVPADAKVVALMPIGFPSDPQAIGPADDTRRKTREEIFVAERFD